MSEQNSVDVVIIGAGAAGLMCAISAGKRGRKVLLLDHANKVGKKILMSGGGRCNFTNLFCDDDNFISHNPHFFKSALSRYTQWDFIAMVEKHNIPYHEKKLGQLFCDNKSSDIVQMLVTEAQAVAVEIRKRCSILEIKKTTEGFKLKSSIGDIETTSLVIATGGLSIPTMGATGFGYEVARQFGMEVLKTRAALVPFTFNQKQLQQFDGLAGLSSEVRVECEGQSFTENILFTHKGLSGPAILQISNYWQPGGSVIINLFPHLDFLQHLKEQQKQRPKAGLVSVLSEHLAKNMANQLASLWCPIKNMADYSYRELEQINAAFTEWKFKPADTEGYRTAEVTLGGVNVDQISSKTMEALNTKGLYFIGEVVDVAGHLGGFNFQWAWASGAAAGEYV